MSEVAAPTASTSASPAADGAVAAPAPATTLPEGASSTVYINNLNEKVKLPILKTSLNSLFSVYGHVLSITAHANLRMRGQAFVAFDDVEIAAKAVKEVNGFPLYGKAMQLSFAKTPSDSVIIKSSGSSDSPSYQEHKTSRLARKAEVKQAALAAKRAKKLSGAAKRKRGEGGDEGGDVEQDAHAHAYAHAQAQKKAVPQLPDEYLPPNPILFVQNLPEAGGQLAVAKEELEGLFAQYEGLQEVRTIPGRPVAFAEFVSAEAAAKAREGLNGAKVGAQTQDPEAKGMRVTFARA